MAKWKVTPPFRARLSEKLMELGNLTGIALAVGQFLTDKPFSWEVFITGIMLMLSCYVVSYFVSS